MSIHWIYTLPEKRIRTAPIALRMRPVLKAAAEKAAKADHRSLTSLVEKLLTEYCREKGFLRDDDPIGKGR
jgi:hypothetical protein